MAQHALSPTDHLVKSLTVIRDNVETMLEIMRTNSPIETQSRDEAIATLLEIVLESTNSSLVQNSMDAMSAHAERRRHGLEMCRLKYKLLNPGCVENEAGNVNESYDTID